MSQTASTSAKLRTPTFRVNDSRDRKAALYEQGRLTITGVITGLSRRSLKSGLRLPSRQLVGAVLVVLLAGCHSPSPAPTSLYQVGIRWTDHGIPHVKASDWGSAGYGFAYAVATDAVCTIAEEVVTVRGERARYFGATEENIDSDVFHKALLDDNKLSELAQRRSYPASDAMQEGYVAGYNRYLADHEGALPASCQDQPWVRAISSDDVTRLGIGSGIRYGLGRFAAAIANAVPNAEVASRPPALLPDRPAREADGSNALAFGRDLTHNGRGILLGNPHYPWHGASRFHIAHLTIPGEVDVMGVGLITTSRIAIGFNQDVAWTHTVSTALRFTVFRLDLDGDLMTYRVGKQLYQIRPISVTVDLAGADGSPAPITRTVYMTNLGPVVVTKETPWDAAHVYVVRDVNYENNRSSDQYHDMARAKNVGELKTALARYQAAAFVNTIAADSSGNAFYADMSAIPFVSSEQIRRCGTGLERIGGRRAVVLNGSDPSCNWRTDPGAAAPGLMPPAEQPSLTTTRFVSNSNDSHWLSSPDQLLEGYSPIIGDEKTVRSLRTRAGLVFVEQALAEGVIDPQTVRDLLFSHRHFGAELLLDDVLAICAAEPATLDVAAACSILAKWDRRQDVDSVGAQVYNEWWLAVAEAIADKFVVPFDVNDPVYTPRGLDVSDVPTRQLVIGGLRKALDALGKAGVTPFSRWGDVQFVMRNGEKIGIPGGNGGAGMYSVISAGLNPDLQGYSPIPHGNSYVQVVGWDESGRPEAQAILTYSQSAEPDSPFYADQTRLYSRSEWIRLPFTDAEIEAQTQRRLALSSGH